MCVCVCVCVCVRVCVEKVKSEKNMLDGLFIFQRISSSIFFL